MKKSERTNRSFKAVAIILIIGFTIIHNRNSNLKTFKDELTHSFKPDTTHQIVKDESDSNIELLSYTTKLFVSGIKQIISNH